MLKYFVMLSTITCLNCSNQRCVVSLKEKRDGLLKNTFYFNRMCSVYNVSSTTLKNTMMVTRSFLPESKDCVVLSWLQSKHNKLLTQLIKDQSANNDKIDKPFPKECREEGVLLSMFEYVVNRMDFGWIAIVVDERDTCRRRLADMLKVRLTSVQVYIFSTHANSPATLLRYFHSLRVSERVYIMLTPHHTTSAFFTDSHDHSMTRSREIWIVEHAVYQQITPVTLTYTHPEPQIILENEAEGVDCVQGLLEKAETTVRYWYNKEWKRLYHITEYNNNNVSITPYISEINLKEILKISKGHSVRAVSILEAPFLYEAEYLLNKNKSHCEERTKACQRATTVDNQTVWRVTCCYGYTVDLIEVLAANAQLQIELYLVEDSHYGAFDPFAKQYNGMVGDVIRGRADVAIAGLTITQARQKYVDFTTPFMQVDLGIVTSLNQTDVDYFNFTFIANLGTVSRWTIAALFLVAILVILAFDNFVLYQKYKVGVRFRRFRQYKWQDCFFYVTGIVFQRDVGGLNPTTKGGRTVAVVFAFAMVAWTTLYTASLTADQVVQGEKYVFKGLQDKRMWKPTKQFTFGTSSSTSIEEFFKNAPDERLNIMYKFMRNYNVHNSYEGLRRVISGELNGYINEYPFLLAMMTNFSSCTLKITRLSAGKTLYGLAVAKNSTLKSIMSQAILKAQEEGDLVDLQRKWLAVCNKDMSLHQEFSLVFFTTPLTLLAGAILFCVALMFVEKTMACAFAQRRKAFHVAGSVHLAPPTFKNITNAKQSSNIKI